MKTSAAPATGRMEVRRVAKGSVTHAAARAGLTARGVIYLLVGVLALRVAFGDGTHQADRSGAVAALADEPFGAVLLWALGIGLVGMAVWQLSVAAFGAAGPDGRKAGTRCMALLRCVFYACVAYSVLSFAAGSGNGGRSSDQQSRDITAQALGAPAGPWLVGAVGAGIVVTGAVIVVQATRRHFHKDLELGGMSSATRRLVDVTGVGGGLARGLVFVAAGVFVVRAAVDSTPDRAKGLDDTLRSFADTPLGPWLLVLVAAGLVLFGLFSFAQARWQKL
ncbi:DUF1206 domain-containing protein [Streptomyces sp. NPDC046197]|uniref:DUF1206 domain-containing protein n=1 Tax=Streptomyces sp. NPDC046197 TaxID=3154337 RepID=UPI0033EB0180